MENNVNYSEQVQYEPQHLVTVLPLAVEQSLYNFNKWL